MRLRPGRRAPVAEQPRLDVLGAQRLAQQRVVLQVDLRRRSGSWRRASRRPSARGVPDRGWARCCLLLSAAGRAGPPRRLAARRRLVGVQASRIGERSPGPPLPGSKPPRQEADGVPSARRAHQFPAADPSAARCPAPARPRSPSTRRSPAPAPSTAAPPPSTRRTDPPTVERLIRDPQPLTGLRDRQDPAPEASRPLAIWPRSAPRCSASCA